MTSAPWKGMMNIASILIMMGAQSGNNNVPILQCFLSRGQGCRRINTQDMTFHLLAAPHGVCLSEPPFNSYNSPLINDVLWRWHEHPWKSWLTLSTCSSLHIKGKISRSLTSPSWQIPIFEGFEERWMLAKCQSLALYNAAILSLLPSFQSQIYICLSVIPCGWTERWQMKVDWSWMSHGDIKEM